MASKRVLVVSLGMLAAGSTASATDVTGALTLVGITPCRMIETRGLGWTGQAGPPSLVANATRTFQITGTVPGLPAQCGIPSTAQAISVNFTVTGFAGQGDVRVFPAGGTLPLASILNYQLENIANATTVPLGPSGGGQKGISVRADAAGTDLIADVNGYYVPRPFTTLESGRTLTGTYGIEFTATASDQRGISAFTFPIKLATAPFADRATNIIPAAGAPTTNCPGTSGDPQALPGNLCIYETYESNIGNRCIAMVGSFYGCDASDVWGSTFYVQSTAAGRTTSVGTWAVTAP